MNKIFNIKQNFLNTLALLGIVIIMSVTIMSCESDSSETPKEDATEVVVKEKEEPKVTTNYYEKSAHDGAWSLALKMNGNIGSGRLIQFEGMLPPKDMIVSGEALEDLTQDLVIDQFEISEDGSSFNSNLGPGVIKDETITFDDIKDYDEKLVLIKMDYKEAH